MAEITILTLAILIALHRRDLVFFKQIINRLIPITLLVILFSVKGLDPYRIMFFIKFAVWMSLIVVFSRLHNLRIAAYIALIGMSFTSIFLYGISKTSAFPFFVIFVALVDFRSRNIWINLSIIGAAIQAYFIAFRGNLGFALLLLLKPIYRFAPFKLSTQFFWISGLIISLHLYAVYVFYAGDTSIAQTASNVERAILAYTAIPNSPEEWFFGVNLNRIIGRLTTAYNWTDLTLGYGTLQTDVHNIFLYTLKYGGIFSLMYIIYIFWAAMQRVGKSPEMIQIMLLVAYIMGLDSFDSTTRLLTAVMLAVLASRPQAIR